MVEITLAMTNDGARAFKRELKWFLGAMNEKLTGERYDRNDSATPAYVLGRTLLEKLNLEISRQDEAQPKATAPREPTIRERRGR